MNEIKQLVDEIFDEAVAIRRLIHQNPELSFEEYETAALVCSYLERLNIPYQSGVAGTGVVGLIEADEAKQTLLLRADMDALPVQEETGLPFASKREGVSHACGHDVHVAIVLGTAMVLARLKHRLKANIKLVFQPAEETTGGALPMIEAGVLENPHVDAAVSGHIMTNVEVSNILVKRGEVMASPDDFEMTVHGRGGHGAYPHECIDPIAITMQILAAWNTLSGRFVSPMEKHLISVNMVHAGTSCNVIPDDAYVSGTVRMYSEAVRKQLANEMKRVAEGICASFGASCDFTYNFRYPPLLNNDYMVNEFIKSARDILGDEHVIEGKEPSMAGEDFAYFAKYVPSVYVNYGGGNDAIDAVHPLHHSAFIADEEAIRCAVLALSQFALNFGA
ncbi:MAG: amidohydrolase [Ruminococcaceae bacterium]|nr:amidohydrolase [Oscillospiraceae bacterium]